MDLPASRCCFIILSIRRGGTEHFRQCNFLAVLKRFFLARDLRMEKILTVGCLLGSYGQVAAAAEDDRQKRSRHTPPIQ